MDSTLTSLGLPLPGIWHNLCFIVDCHIKIFYTYIDEALVFNNSYFDCEKSQFIQKNIEIFGTSQIGDYRKRFVLMNDYLLAYICNIAAYLFFSVFGAFTDINIWKDTLDLSEMQSWANLSLENGGDYLNWTSIQLDVSNLIEDTISGDEVRYRISRIKKDKIIIMSRYNFLTMGF